MMLVSSAKVWIQTHNSNKHLRITCDTLYLVAPCVYGSVDLIQSSGAVSTSSSGTIRLCVNSSSSTSNNHQLICDYGWDFDDARVACTSLGYSPYGAVALHNQYISSTAGYSFLAYMNCNGSEANLNECQSQSWIGPCYSNFAGAVCQGWLWNEHVESLYVRVLHVQYMHTFVYIVYITGIEIVPDNCEHGSVKLIGGTKEYEGNVEVCINGMWSLICDSGWSTNDASVACSQAGYPGPG